MSIERFKFFNSHWCSSVLRSNLLKNKHCETSSKDHYNMTGLEVGGWFASAFVEKLTYQVRSYIGDQYEYQTTKIKDKLESLAGNMNKIHEAIQAADQKHMENPDLKKWLLDLKGACYDAEDVLDLFEYQLLEDKVKEYQPLEDKVKEKSQVWRFFAETCELFKGARVIAKRFFFSDDELNELYELVDRFDKLENQMEGFHQLFSLDLAAKDKEGESSEIMLWRSTNSYFTEPKLFGRDTEKTRLIELLQEKGGDEVGRSRKLLHVLPIVGIGGVGKTTLAQSVYNEQSVKNFFDLTAWVCVSDKFELRRLMVEIIESASIEKPPEFYNIKSLDRIRQILMMGLMGKRFLLVLDDVWNEEPDEWEKLHSALEAGDDGSKVIVTTRSHKIAYMMGTKKAISLGGLADKQYWEYFFHYAFGGVRLKDHLNLILYADEIVKRLGGLPLAAKVMGNVLRSSLEEKHWKEISESKWWQVDRPKDQIMPVLRLSYDYLPARLKQCFVYCSLFPKDYRFSARKLIWLWMAQGYIPDNEENTMENIGYGYFKELLSTSFFEKVDDDKYVIHDLLHDLAQYLSSGESFTVYDYTSDIKPEDIPKKVRHIYTSANNLPIVCNDKYAKKNLRSLVVSGRCDVSLDILEELEGLRVLILDSVRTSSPPECFRKMLHLRYLEIIDQEGDPLVWPQSLGKLYHLQVLYFSNYFFPLSRDSSYSVPKGINKLSNLRHLYAYMGEIVGIGTLISLQELNFFVKKERGFESWQLRDMSQLRELSMEDLENIESKEQASEARLSRKWNLKFLGLHWGAGSHSDPDGVLEGLEPPHGLEYLAIKGYNGKCCPSWWNENCLTYINHIDWSYFSSWEILPPFGQFPLLRSLSLSQMEAVKRIGSEFYGSNNTKPFPSLETLCLYEMSELAEWCKPEGEGIEPFPRLSYLDVDSCLKLRGPLCLPSHLKELHVAGRETLYDPGEKGIYLFGCPNMSRFIEWIPMQNLASMKKVDITFHEITSFTSEQEEWFQHLTSLQSLSFYDCNNLQSLPSILSLSTLCELSVRKCPSLQSLPEEGLPSSLAKLHLSGISQVLKERCREGGLDWQKISHIPNIGGDESSSDGEQGHKEKYNFDVVSISHPV